MLSSQVGNEQVTAPGLQELQAGGRGRVVPRLSWYKAEQELCHLRGSGGEGLPKLQGGVRLAGISTGAISGRRKRALLAGRTAHTYSEMGTGLTQGAHAKLGPTSEPLCTLFPVLEAPFPQMSAWLAISPPSDLCLNVTSSGKPSLLTLCKIASLSPCRILPFCFAL